jgi:hypothetical protein
MSLQLTTWGSPVAPFSAFIPLFSSHIDRIGLLGSTSSTASTSPPPPPKQGWQGKVHASVSPLLSYPERRKKSPGSSLIPTRTDLRIQDTSLSVASFWVLHPGSHYITHTQKPGTISSGIYSSISRSNLSLWIENPNDRPRMSNSQNWFSCPANANTYLYITYTHTSHIFMLYRVIIEAEGVPSNFQCSYISLQYPLISGSKR